MEIMKTKVLPLFFSCLALLVLTGCATTVTRDPVDKKAVISSELDQKDLNDAAATMIESLKKFINEQGKLLPRRLSGNSLKYQRKVQDAVKKARQMGLLPYVTDLLK